MLFAEIIHQSGDFLDDLIPGFILGWFSLCHDYLLLRLSSSRYLFAFVALFPFTACTPCIAFDAFSASKCCELNRLPKYSTMFSCSSWFGLLSALRESA